MIRFNSIRFDSIHFVSIPSHTHKHCLIRSIRQPLPSTSTLASASLAATYLLLLLVVVVVVLDSGGTRVEAQRLEGKQSEGNGDPARRGSRETSIELVKESLRSAEDGVSPSCAGLKAHGVPSVFIVFRMKCSRRRIYFGSVGIVAAFTLMFHQALSIHSEVVRTKLPRGTMLLKPSVGTV